MNKPLAFIIEDDKNLAAAFGEAVSEAGYDTEIIHDGQTAMDRLAEVLPATIVLDLHIPYVKGTNILDFIRGDERLKDVNVVVATADDRLGELTREKANLVLLKPIGYSLLRDLTDRLKPKE